MRPFGISDRTSPDSTKVGEWLFRHRTAIPLPLAISLLAIRTGQASYSLTLLAAGTGLVALGEALRLWAVRHIGAISRTRSTRLGPLVATGPFGFTRNPLYVGNIALWAGFALTARLVWMAPLLVMLLVAEYQAIVRWEEQQMHARYGEMYGAYAARVPRWVPRLGRVTCAKQARLFSWGETFFAERGTLVAIATGYLLLWLKSAARP